MTNLEHHEPQGDELLEEEGGEHVPPPTPPDADELQPDPGEHNPQGDPLEEAVEDGPAEEQAVEHDLDQLVAKARERDEYLALAQRTQADFENYRKRVAREAASAQARGAGALARDLLDAIDNLDRALGAAPADGEGAKFAEGVRLVHAELTAALARNGIEPFAPHGEPFDPTQHEAMAQQPAEGAAPGTVIEVYSPGYRQNGEVLRPARVVVAG